MSIWGYSRSLATCTFSNLFGILSLLSWLNSCQYSWNMILFQEGREGSSVDSILGFSAVTWFALYWHKNHRIVQVGRNFMGSPSPTSLLEQGPLDGCPGPWGWNISKDGDSIGSWGSLGRSLTTLSATPVSFCSDWISRVLICTHSLLSCQGWLLGAVRLPHLRSFPSGISTDQ